MSQLWIFAILADYYIQLAFIVVCVILAVIALLRCLPKPSDMFFVQGKRTKGFWLGITGAAVALSLIGLFSHLSPPGAFSLLFPVVGACMASVYLADVDPAVSGR